MGSFYKRNSLNHDSADEDNVPDKKLKNADVEDEIMALPMQD
jgi:hypothetical protein